MDMPVTAEFIEAVRDGADAITDRARQLEQCPEFKADNSVGNIVRHNVELAKQRSAMMLDWARRAKSLLTPYEQSGDRLPLTPNDTGTEPCRNSK
jgi:hypothetical protein